MQVIVFVGDGGVEWWSVLMRWKVRNDKKKRKKKNKEEHEKKKKGEEKRKEKGNDVGKVFFGWNFVKLWL